MSHKIEGLTKKIEDLRKEGKTYDKIASLLNVSYTVAWGRVNPRANKIIRSRAKGLLTKENKMKMYSQRLENHWKEIKLKDMK